MNKKNSWKILSRTKVLKTPVFDVYKEKTVCPRNNFCSDFYVIECPNSWVNVVAITNSNKIIMIKQYRAGTKTVELEIPGGLIDIGESPLNGGIRELEEETGYIGNKASIIGKVCPNPALQSNICYTVLVEGASRKAKLSLDEAEDIKTLLVPVDDLKKIILSGEISHGLVLNALYFFELYCKR
jgi:8-oxo-dGTP pyrophosphatase MutT (NUDIX family)